MVLKNNLYNIIDRDGGMFRIRLNPDCFIYKAHFPEQPVTPGVCVVQIAVELAEELLGSPLEMVGAKNVKFMQTMCPEDGKDTDVTYNITVSDTGNSTVRIQALTGSPAGDIVYAKMSLNVKHY